MTLPFTAAAPVFLVVSVIILLAPPLAERLRIPGVVGLVLAGLAVGPDGLGLLHRVGTIDQVGGFGLLYLMFLAGLELDLEEAARFKKATAVFGLLTFAIPMGLGLGVALALDFSLPAAVLIGSLWASHTLVSYPIIRRNPQASGNKAVAVALGATAITDTLALLVLAGVARWSIGEGSIASWSSPVVGLVALAVFTARVLPAMTDRFFRGIGQDRTLRFVYVLASFLGASVIAEASGIEPIVGAFAAGLSLNRRIPRRSPLMDRVEFVGSALLIPIFLISVGMLIDPTVIAELDTLALAAAFTAVVIVAKWLAAAAAARVFHFDKAERSVMFSLSSAQAAATLAATVVGFELEILDLRTVNAVLVVILVTVMLSASLGRRHAFSITGSIRMRPLGAEIVVPVSRPESALPLLRLAAALARAAGGNVTPVSIVPEATADAATLDRARTARDASAQAASQIGLEMEPVVRVDSSVAAGVRRVALELRATAVVIGLPGPQSLAAATLGGVLEEVIDETPTPVIVGQLNGPAATVRLASGGSERDRSLATTVARAIAVGGSRVVEVGDWHEHMPPRSGEVLVVPGDPGQSALHEVAAHDGSIVFVFVNRSRPPTALETSWGFLPPIG